MLKNILDRHHCDAVVLACIDFRFGGSEGTSAFKKTFKLTDDGYDLITLPGGGQNLTGYALTPEYSQAATAAIGLGVELHQSETVIVLSHQDCGALKAVGKIFSPEESLAERQFHHDLLQNAILNVHSKWPSVNIRAGYVHVVDAEDGQMIAVREVV